MDAIPEDSDDYLSALIVKADLYQMEGLTDVARDKLLEASQLSDDSLIIFGLAEMEFELGNFEQAIQYYAKLDNRDLLAMTGVSTYERIGKAYASLGKFEAAREFLEKAIEIEYDDTIAFELATLLYDQEEYQKANFYFKQIETMSADFEGYEYFYALSLHAEHKTEEALRMAQQGISKNAFDVQLLLLASQLSYELHDTQSAESYLKQALPLAEDQDEIVLRLSTLYLEEERYEDLVALADYEVDSVWLAGILPRPTKHLMMKKKLFKSIKIWLQIYLKILISSMIMHISCVNLVTEIRRVQRQKNTLP